MTNPFFLFPRDCWDLMDSVDQRFSHFGVPENGSPSVACTKPGTLSFSATGPGLTFETS